MSKRVGIDDGRLISELDGDRVSLPAGGRPLERIQHVVGPYLDPVERAGFESLMGVGLGCSEVIVRDKLEDATRASSVTDPTASVKTAHPEADIRETLAAIAAIVNDVPGSRLAKFPQYKTPAYIPRGKELACFIRGLASALLPIKGSSLADYGGRARPLRKSAEDTDECWLALYQGLNAASRLNVSAPGKAWRFVAVLKRVNNLSNGAPAEKNARISLI
jgi:hypothetical protein